MSGFFLFWKAFHPEGISVFIMGSEWFEARSVVLTYDAFSATFT